MQSEQLYLAKFEFLNLRLTIFKHLCFKCFLSRRHRALSQLQYLELRTSHLIICII